MHRRFRTLLEPPNPLDRFARLNRRADAANARRDWPAAERGYAGALGIDPLRDDLWVQYGHTLKEQGRLAAAAEAYGQAARLNPRALDARLHAAHANRALGRDDEARAAFRAVLTIDPGRQEARAELAAMGDNRPVTALGPMPFHDADDGPVRSRDDASSPPGPASAALSRRLVPEWKGGHRAERPTVFFHLHKTGGLTLDDLIGDGVAPWRVCPVKDDRVHVLDRVALDSYALFSAHCDIGLLRLLGKPTRTVSLFREPRARLISFYRFHRGHDLAGKHGINQFAQLANAMSAEDFFEDDRIRRTPEVFNHYLTVFSLTYHQVRSASRVAVDRVTSGHLEKAITRVRGLDAIGILERFDDSVALICSALGLPRPAEVVPLNATDALTARMKREPAPRVPMTPRLAAALADLVRFDDPIYAAAVETFEQRLAALHGESTS